MSLNRLTRNERLKIAKALKDAAEAEIPTTEIASYITKKTHINYKAVIAYLYSQKQKE